MTIGPYDVEVEWLDGERRVYQVSGGVGMMLDDRGVLRLHIVRDEDTVPDLVAVIPLATVRQFRKIYP